MEYTKKLKQYDSIILKDGRRGTVVEIWGKDGLSVDVGSSPTDWDNIEITWDDIVQIIHNN